MPNGQSYQLSNRVLCEEKTVANDDKTRYGDVSVEHGRCDGSRPTHRSVPEAKGN